MKESSLQRSSRVHAVSMRFGADDDRDNVSQHLLVLTNADLSTDASSRRGRASQS